MRLVDCLHDERGAVALGEWFETSKVGRALTLILVAAILFTLTVWNLPDSHIKDQLRPPLRPVVWAVGLDQNWGVFAPNPRSIGLDLHAEVDFADGSIEIWRPPAAGEQLLAPWRVYRWRKWIENVRSDDNQRLWEPAARFVANEMTEAGKNPTQIRLVRRWYDLPAPGHPVVTPSWNAFTFYTWDVP